jgi:hypothetical protein
MKGGGASSIAVSFRMNDRPVLKIPDQCRSISCGSSEECESGLGFPNDLDPGTLRRKLCISLKCFKISLGNFRVFRPANKVALVSL